MRFMHEENDQKAVIAALRRQWAIFAAFCILFMAGGFGVLWFAWQPVYAVAWLFLPVITLVYQLSVLWRNLGANFRPGEERLLPDLGWGNRLTLLRSIFVAAMTGFLFLPQPASWLIWLPGALYILSDAADFFDGYVARVTNHSTRLGEILDMSFDGLGVLVASLLAVQYGQVPAWYVLVGLARYLFLAAEWLRRKMGRPLFDLPHSPSRRIFAGLQMGFLAAILLPLFSPPGTHIAAALFGLPLLLGFARDGLYASGILQPAGVLTEKRHVFLRKWLPVAMRASILVVSVGLLSRRLAAYPGLSPEQVALDWLNTLVVGLLILGVAPRISAIVALCLLGLYQMSAGLSVGQIYLAVAYTFILYQGGGVLSLWTPEEHLFHRRAGEQRALNLEQPA
jgi:CDP-diacylglycerol--glycerol-3-phosphate 3-phosphatidyltransferase